VFKGGAGGLDGTVYVLLRGAFDGADILAIASILLVSDVR
jgi:hypothetical protein